MTQSVCCDVVVWVCKRVLRIFLMASLPCSRSRATYICCSFVIKCFCAWWLLTLSLLSIMLLQWILDMWQYLKSSFHFVLSSMTFYRWKFVDGVRMLWVWCVTCVSLFLDESKLAPYTWSSLSRESVVTARCWVWCVLYLLYLWSLISCNTCIFSAFVSIVPHAA